MDIEDRAERWARELANERDLSDYGPGIHEELVEAYLAGAGQAQRDYVQHYERG